MSEQPRLLLCCFEVLPGPHALSRRVTEYLKGLSDRFQVVVLSTKTPDHSHIERYQGARLLRVPVGSGNLQSRIQAFDRAVRRQIESEEYVIAHFFDPFGGYALAEARAQYGFRLVYDAQSFPSMELKYTHPETDGDRRFQSKVKRQELYCLMNADAVVTGSEVTRDYVLSQGTPAGALLVIPSPVDLLPFTPEVMGRPDGTPMKVMYLGSQLGYQGLSVLLRAMQLALRQADLRLKVVGPSHAAWQPALDDLVSELKLTGKIEFQPPVPHDDLHKVLATCDLGVLPLEDTDRNRLQGGTLGKLGEYLAAGRPVLAADLPVVRELAPEGAVDFFQPGDFKALADKLVALAGAPAQRVKMGELARAAATRFDASAARGQLIDLYDRLAVKGRRNTGTDPVTAEITQLRPTGGDNGPGTGTGKVALPRADGTEPGAAAKGVMGRPLREDTLDEEPPVVVGQQLDTRQAAADLQRAAVTEPGSGAEAPVVMGRPLEEAPPPEPTPIIKDKRRRSGKHKAHLPGDGATEPTPITSARERKSRSSSAHPAPPEPTPITGSARLPEPTPIHKVSTGAQNGPSKALVPEPASQPDEARAPLPPPVPVEPVVPARTASTAAQAWSDEPTGEVRLTFPPEGQGEQPATLDPDEKPPPPVLEQPVPATAQTVVRTPAAGLTAAMRKSTPGVPSPLARLTPAHGQGAAARESTPGVPSPAAPQDPLLDEEPPTATAGLPAASEPPFRQAMRKSTPGTASPVAAAAPLLDEEPRTAADRPVVPEVPARAFQQAMRKSTPGTASPVAPPAPVLDGEPRAAAALPFAPEASARAFNQAMRKSTPGTAAPLAAAQALEAAPGSSAAVATSLPAGTGPAAAPAIASQTGPLPEFSAQMRKSSPGVRSPMAPPVLEPAASPARAFADAMRKSTPGTRSPLYPPGKGPPPSAPPAPTAPRPSPAVGRAPASPAEEPTTIPVLMVRGVSAPAPAAPGHAEGDEPEEISSEEIDEVSDADDADEVQASDVDEVAPTLNQIASALDPWLAQLAHGYCPPEADEFHRPPPPTTFPGRDGPAKG